MKKKFSKIKIIKILMENMITKMLTMMINQNNSSKIITKYNIN